MTAQSGAMNANASTLLPLGPTAQYLRVPVGWLREEAESGRVPHLKAGNSLLFDPQAVERVLLERAKQPPENAADVAPENAEGDA